MKINCGSLNSYRRSRARFSRPSLGSVTACMPSEITTNIRISIAEIKSYLIDAKLLAKSNLAISMDFACSAARVCLPEQTHRTTIFDGPVRMRSHSNGSAGEISAWNYGNLLEILCSSQKHGNISFSSEPFCIRATSRYEFLSGEETTRQEASLGFCRVVVFFWQVPHTTN